MRKLTAVFLTGGLLAARPACAISQELPLCKVGSSVVELLYLHSTGANTRVEPALVGSTLVFLQECPASVIPAFSRFSNSFPELRQAWIEAVRSAARDSSNTEVSGLLAVARERVAHLDDPSLNDFLDGIFESSTDTREMDWCALESLYERHARAALKQVVEGDGLGCFHASDIVRFLLGTHPVAVFRAMRADSAAAAEWLYLVPHRSLTGPPESREIREAARRAVIEKLAATKAPGFEREQRACEDTMREIRYYDWS